MKEISGKIKWQSRRGMRELDLMLLPFVDQDLPTMNDDIISDYEDLLLASDLELVRWFNGTATPDTEKRQNMVALIKKCHASRMGHEGV
ncbi:MAG: succinate dehydrogenase assembly factor 2 [Succinatimonas sp.]|nr:succinate dehydrogenase assembly factor 2 [Succinatimonas sp.]